MLPPKALAALLIVRVRLPSVTAPLPVNPVTDAPAVAPEISNVPLSTTTLEAATLPLPVSASVPPLIVVAPLYVLLPVSVCVPAFSVIPPVPPMAPA